MIKKIIPIILLGIISTTSFSNTIYNALITQNFTVSTNIETPVTPLVIIAEITGLSNGSQIETHSSLISGNNYLDRKFFTELDVGGHGPLHSHLEIIFDAGEGNHWEASNATLISKTNLYPNLAPVSWYMSNDLSNWTTVGEYAGGGSTSSFEINGTKERYLKIFHNIQPLNDYSLSYSSYNNLDLKIIEN